MAIVCVGIDLAKNVFAVHGINEAGRPQLVRLKGAGHRPRRSCGRCLADASRLLANALVGQPLALNA